VVLRSRGTDATIVASGSQDDSREPGYFDGIMREISERKLSRSFRYLGMIPLSHVYALLRMSMALINPSRFEGWSTTVEEAKSFGVPMILSDLDVHREQTAGRAMYFGTDDPASLADHIASVAHDAEPAFVRNLIPGLEDRVSMFAADFGHTIRTAIESRRSVRRQT
jgi:glycosyltransferase involved in cell wall biosynthesis